MPTLTAREIAEIAGGEIIAGQPDTPVTGGIGTDTRKLASASLFVALRGERFDGDSFATTALEGGAAAALVHRWQGGGVPAGTAVITVADTLLALQKLARWWRMRLDLPVVAVTGSNGKTGTKDFIAAVLGRRYQVSATAGNLNNHIGVPLTVLATTRDHTAAVWEMGMNHAGEIAPLCEIARPRYGVITNIGTAHIEFLGSREAIAEEKGMLARALPADGVLFVPATCDFNDYLRQRCKAQLIATGNGRGLVRAEDLRHQDGHCAFTLVIEDHGRAEVVLPVPGKHMVANALLAAAVGWKLGIAIDDIAAGLTHSTLTGGRLRQFTRDGVTVIDDTYNANPESMAAAIDTLADSPVANGGRRIIVLGRMGELGPHAPEAHRRTGWLAASRGLTVIAVGEGAEGIAEGAGGAAHHPDLAAAGRWLASHLKAGDIVLFKGSRAAAVETALHAAFPTR